MTVSQVVLDALTSYCTASAKRRGEGVESTDELCFSHIFSFSNFQHSVSLVVDKVMSAKTDLVLIISGRFKSWSDSFSQKILLFKTSYFDEAGQNQLAPPLTFYQVACEFCGFA